MQRLDLHRCIRSSFGGLDLARLLESGGFDSLFIADVLGVYDVYRDSVETSLIDADQVPVNDPFMQISAMAAVTKRLGFGVTAARRYFG